MGIEIGLLGIKFHEHARKRILEEFKRMNLKVVKLNLGKLCLSIDGKLSGFQDKVKLDELDVVLPRFSTGHYRFGLITMRQLEAMGIPTINSYRAIKNCQNKYLTSLLLSKNNIPQPRAYLASSSAGILREVKNLETLEFFKLLHGGKGSGVALINSSIEAEDWISTMSKVGRLIYLQEYIPHEKNEDYRLFVLGNEVIGAMKRISVHGWKTNFSLGNKVEVMKPDSDLIEMALKSAKAVEADICGVDIMKGKTGNQVIEVNQHPGFEGLEKATGKNIARKIAQYTIKQVKK